MWRSNNKVIYIIATMTLIVGVLFIAYKNKPVEYDDIPGSGVVVDVKDIAEKSNDLQEKEDSGVEDTEIVTSTTAVKMTIKDIRENGSKIYVVVDIGIGENRKESSISVESGTIIYDYKLERMVGPYALVEGAEVVYYGAVDYNAGNTVAEAIILGVGEESIKFGRLGDVYQDKTNNSYIANIQGTRDMLRLTDLTVYRNVTTDKEMGDIRDAAPNSRVFYSPSNVEGETAEGQIYKIDKLFIVAKERDEHTERKVE